MADLTEQSLGAEEPVRNGPGAAQPSEGPETQGSGAGEKGGSTDGIPSVPTLAALVDAWRESIRIVEGRNDRTAKTYSSMVLRMAADLDLEQPADFTREAIERFVKRLSYAGRGRARVGFAIVALRQWCRWLVAHGHLPRNPVLELRSPKPYRKARKVLTVPEVRRLVLGESGTLPRSKQELVAVVYFATLYGGALRPMEPARLRTQDVEWHPDEGMFSVLLRETKHAHEDRRQFLGVPVSRLLGAYLQLRPDLAPGPLLFPRPSGRAWDPEQLAKAFTRLVEAKAIERKGRELTPRILRASRCTHLLNAKHHPKVVQLFMRHSSIETTMAHYAYIDDGRIPSMLLRGEPLSGQRKPGPQVHGSMRLVLDELGRAGFSSPSRPAN